MADVNGSGEYRDLTFTSTVNLLWQFYEQAAERGRHRLAADLVVAIGELHNGPWQHLGDAPGRLHVPFVQACMAVDEHLDRLQDITPGLAARASIDAVREILDGTHRSGDHR